MKIVFITATLTSGGSERVMSILANKLEERGHAVTIVCLNQRIVFYTVDPNVKILFAEDYCGGNILKKMSWLRKYVSQNRPDVVIPFMVAVYCVTILSLMGIHVPIISSERNDPRYTSFTRKLLRWILLPFTSHFVVQTQLIYNYFPSFIRKKTTIIYNPVTDKVFSQSQVQKRERTIISIGKFHKQKNQRMLINAFARVSQEFPDYKLVIWGDGPLRSSLEKQINSYQLQERILLPGKSSDITTELGRAALFCFTSDFEGLSNAMLEAVCVGLPVLTTNVSGASDLVEDNVNGFIVPVGDTDAFVSRLRILLRNDQLLSQMGEESKKKRVLFDVNTITDQWERLISEVVKKAKP